MVFELNSGNWIILIFWCKMEINLIWIEFEFCMPYKTQPLLPHCHSMSLHEYMISISKLMTGHTPVIFFFLLHHTDHSHPKTYSRTPLMQNWMELESIKLFYFLTGSLPCARTVPTCTGIWSSTVHTKRLNFLQETFNPTDSILQLYNYPPIGSAYNPQITKTCSLLIKVHFVIVQLIRVAVEVWKF